MPSQKTSATRSTISVYSTIPWPLEFTDNLFFVEHSGVYMNGPLQEVVLSKERAHAVGSK
jgi:hypothetical protein